ncbi:hypothetical protein IQ272_32780, partial [Chroococcidiopsidales cyanobacterium LEGE 13417]|nr:hypothetical protein [Chroococcidiopsidales cyanobacterium LEGE 13417]
PELHKPAFEARLDKLEEELLSEETARTQPGRLCRRLAELIFLAIVVPEQGEESLSRSALIDKVQMLLASLRTSEKEAVNRVIQNLRQRAASMQLIATALISTLRARGQKVIAQVQQNSCQHFICVKRGIVEWTRLKGAEPGVRDLLVGPQQSAREQIEWFKHIEICDRPDTPNLLFSVQVTTEILEHDLMTNGEPQQIKAQRLLPQQLLQICWVPYCAQKQNDGWIYKVAPNTVEAKGWVLPASIHIEYEPRTLTRKQNKKQAEESKQYHAAAVCAFAVLVYCSLWCTIKRLKQFEDRVPEFTALMLRLQETSRPNDENSGDSYVYAAAQTIEAMLAQDVRIRMQGLALENLTKQNNSYVKLGVFDALSSAFPIALDTPTPPVVAK